MTNTVRTQRSLVGYISAGQDILPRIMLLMEQVGF